VVSRRLFVLFCMVVGSSVTFIGCGRGDGPETGEVSGKVTLNGDPVKGATVYFYPDGGGRASSSVTNEKGAYELYYKGTQKGAKVGMHAVTLTTGTPNTTDDNGKVIKGIPEVFPPEYVTGEAVKREVKPGRNEINFEITTM